MSERYEFYVTIGTSDAVDDEETAAELLQWAVRGANKSHDHINYITVQHSEMSAAEKGRLLDLLERPTSEDIDKAIGSLEALQE